VRPHTVRRQRLALGDDAATRVGFFGRAQITESLPCSFQGCGSISHAAARTMLTPSAAGDLGSEAFMSGKKNNEYTSRAKGALCA